MNLEMGPNSNPPNITLAVMSTTYLPWDDKSLIGSMCFSIFLLKQLKYPSTDGRDIPIYGSKGSSLGTNGLSRLACFVFWGIVNK
jgi:hypothetical protein